MNESFYTLNNTAYLDIDDGDGLEANPQPRCQHCQAFVPTQPTSVDMVQGPDILRWTGVDCSRCQREVWGFDDVIGSVWPRFDLGYDVEPQEDYPDFEPPVEMVEVGCIGDDDLPF